MINSTDYTSFPSSRLCDFMNFLSVFKISFIFQSRNGHNCPVSLITSKGAVEFRLGGWGSVSSVKKQSCQIFPAGLHIKRTFENTPSVFESPFLNSLYCRHGSISHFIYDQIQDEQVHRIKCVKEIFHAKATFSIVKENWNKCKHCSPFPPYKSQTSKHDLL